ncbi:hypothetical protein RD792_004691 [Penstemon davidsonii]|uniref:Purple acid phosphatase n=1 Tax=Penstemon davidsonii TaxID=160366 RepID=A0ABR0DI26_9LAMI|nr:hypothetical protein RD792_004682 [Penstemon davidsonii]KAK4488901.1 hypothetical protein RD792_004691 [Penstemon davidsonii]
MMHMATNKINTINYQISILVVINILVFEIFFMHIAYAVLERFEHPIKADGSLSVLVIGDWGRKGQYNQSKLAYQMGITAEKIDVDFVISTGDNFYPSGLTNVYDPAFDQSFTNVYTAPSLQKQWYSVLGNHDYRGDALAQLSPILKHKDSKWLCLKSFILNTALGESRAKWKIVVGHHTIKSVGIHGDTQELVQKVLPILQANDVDLYINGHDHCLEHISSSDSSIQFLTSGGGSKAWRGGYNWMPNSEEMKFYYDGQGFMTLQITQTDIDIRFYDISGKILHKWSASKSLLSTF